MQRLEVSGEVRPIYGSLGAKGVILVQDISLCLSIILKWNKIYTLSNTTNILSKIDQHYAPIITPLFDTQASICFDIHVPSSGSFLCPYELLEGRNG
jgi:hypothetical protein